MKGRTWKWLMAVLSGFVIASAQAESRVAMMGVGLDESGAAAVELAEAKLSVRPDLVLLDRRTIDSVLQEQKLQADGLVSAADAIRFGQLLSVDLFVHVEPIPGQPAVAVVAYETAQGIRLLDEMAGGTDAEAMASDIETAVVHAMAKWQAPAGQTTAIALMSVRNVDLPRSRNAECDSLGTLLERRLLGSPEVVVVERQRLESLNRDREVTMDRPEGRLLSAPVLVDLDVSQSRAEGGLQATAFLSDPKGAELGNVHAEGEALPALADRLCSDILDLLKKESAPLLSNPVLESARFFRISRFWKAQGRFDLMLAAAEAAYALDPNNNVMQDLLINALFTSANVTIAENRPEALDCAARGMALVLQPAKEPTPSDVEQQRRIMRVISANHQFIWEFGKNIRGSEIQNPLSNEESALYAEFCRDWLAQSPFSPEAEISPSGWELGLFIDCYSHYFPDPESAWNILSQQTKRWVQERIETESPERVTDFLTKLITAGDSESRPLFPDFYRVRADLWKYFEERNNPLLRLFAQCGRIVDAARLNQEGSWIQNASTQKFLHDMASAILNGGIEAGIPVESLYNCMLMATLRSGEHDYACAEHLQERFRQQTVELVYLIQVMLQAGDVRSGVIIRAQNLLHNSRFYGLDQFGLARVYELDAVVDVALQKWVDKYTSDELRQLKEFHVWIQEMLAPGSTLSPPEDHVRLEPIELVKPWGKFLWHAAILSDCGGAYVISASRDPSQLILQKWLSESATTKFIGTVDLQGPQKLDIGMNNAGGVADVCLGETFVAVAVADEGVFLFDQCSTAVEPLHQTTTLPITHPLSVGVLDKVLYIGTDDGYLVAYNTETRSGTVLIASSRKGKKTPFDDGPPARISAIFPDPERKRIVFVASVTGAEGKLDGAESEMSGIWEYHVVAGNFQQRLVYKHVPSGLMGIEMVDKDSFVMQGRSLGTQTIRYNLSSDEVDILSLGTTEKTGIYVEQLIQAVGLDRLQAGVTPVQQRRFDISPPFLAVGDWLLTADPWGRLSMKTYQWEKLPPFRMPDGTVKEIYPNVGMISISDTQVLLAHRFQLWLMTEENGQ